MDTGKYRPHKDAKLIIGVQNQIVVGKMYCSRILGQYF